MEQVVQVSDTSDIDVIQPGLTPVPLQVTNY